MLVQPGQDHIKRVIAEMGGKNAIVVDDDADLDDAVRGTVASAFGYQGQKCSAASRAIVIGDLYESFVERLAEAAASLAPVRCARAVQEFLLDRCQTPPSESGMDPPRRRCGAGGAG